MSSRTLYKQAGSKVDLIVEVLAARERRFFLEIDVGTVAALFEALARWIDREGTRGCLLLRAVEETGGSEPKITAAVVAYKQRLQKRIAQIVAAELGRDDGPLAGQILLLVEGATAASIYLGSGAARTAADTAAQLLAARRA